MKELKLEQMERIVGGQDQLTNAPSDGGGSRVGACAGLAFAVIGVGFTIAFPPSGTFLIPAIGTVAGVGLGIAADSCIFG